MLRVLYVERSGAYQALMKEAVRRLFGAELESATSPVEALFLLRCGQRFDVVISEYVPINGRLPRFYEELAQEEVKPLLAFFVDPYQEVPAHLPGDHCLGVVFKPDFERLCETITQRLTTMYLW